MNDFISRKWLMECVDEGWIKFDTEKDKNRFIHLVRDIAPSADVQPVRHGCFIGTEYDGYADGSPVYYEWKCSECGCIFEDPVKPTIDGNVLRCGKCGAPIVDGFVYCPNCGREVEQ